MGISALEERTELIEQTLPGIGAARFYRPELDGLRFMAFLLVFCSHSFYSLTGGSWVRSSLRCLTAGGGFGVDLFFILSAYLITELFRREKQSTGTIDVRAFYVRRILRIWPLYFGYVAFWFLVRKFVPPPEVFPASALVAFLSLSGNWYMAAVQTTSPFHSPVGPLWSVSVEEQFYLIWPLLVRVATKKKMVIFSCSLWAMSYLTQLLLFRGGAVFLVVWFNSLVHGGAIATGILAAVLLDGRTPRINKHLRVAMCVGALPLLGMATACFNFAVSGWTPILYGPAGFCFGLLGVILLFFGFLGAPMDGIRFVTAGVLIYLGRISYGLYVFHYAVLDMVQYAFVRLSGSCPLWIRFGLGLTISITLAWASYRWFESPFLKLKHRFARIDSGAV
jgi:peptidoglycan/LPS O-acetylase OafA/YrhL